MKIWIRKRRQQIEVHVEGAQKNNPKFQTNSNPIQSLLTNETMITIQPNPYLIDILLPIHDSGN